MKKRNTNRILSASALTSTLVVTTLALLVSTSPAQAAGPTPTPGVFPINSAPYGKTYGEWSAKWWQWDLSCPPLPTRCLTLPIAARDSRVRCGF